MIITQNPEIKKQKLFSILKCEDKFTYSVVTLNDDGELEPLIDRSRQVLYIGRILILNTLFLIQIMTSEWNLHIIDKNNEYSENEKLLIIMG